MKYKSKFKIEYRTQLLECKDNVTFNTEKYHFSNSAFLFLKINCHKTFSKQRFSLKQVCERKHNRDEYKSLVLQHKRKKGLLK